MNEMVKRVAKALASYDCYGDESGWQNYAAEARTAIAAMRPATPKMEQAMAAVLPAEVRAQYFCNMHPVWHAGIDAALGEQGEG